MCVDVWKCFSQYPPASVFRYKAAFGLWICWTYTPTSGCCGHTYFMSVDKWDVTLEGAAFQDELTANGLFFGRERRTVVSLHTRNDQSLLKIRSSMKCIHPTATRVGNPTPKPTTHETQLALQGGQKCVQLCMYVRVFMCVCLCGMAGQRNAPAHAWLSRHNGPALSHCREIPPWYRDRKRVRERNWETKTKCWRPYKKMTLFHSKH